jgi:hypothetical protein
VLPRYKQRYLGGNKLNNLSRKELAEIYCKLNHYEWDDRLGEKPANFDELPNYDRSLAVDKHRLIEPYMREITTKTTAFDRARAWHLTFLKRSKWQFYRYWLVEGCRRYLITRKLRKLGVI